MTMLMFLCDLTMTIYNLEESQVRKDHDFDADYTEEEFQLLLQKRKAARKS